MKPTASVSLDLDNQWSYMKTHGDPAWASFPSYLDIAVPRILNFLADRDLKITFFIVGQDAALDKNREAIASIAAAGHEIGNHSFNHEPWLHLYSKSEIIEEFEKTESALEAATGVQTVGFRGPGFSLSPAVIDVIGERGYEYDCSLLPTYIGPLARAYFLLKSPDVSAQEKEKLKKLYGKFSDGLRTLRPHIIEAAGRSIVEIPVTTFPVVKAPVHATYIAYLGTFSMPLAKAYWSSAVAACRATGVEPSLLLHPLDFLSGEDIPELKFFPGMSMPSAAKLRLMDTVLSTLTNRFEAVNMREHARRFRAGQAAATEPGVSQMAKL